MLPKMFTEDEVEKLWGVKKSTLQKMRSNRVRDPIPFTKVGGSVRYREDLMRRWLDRNTFNNTDEYFESKTG